MIAAMEYDGAAGAGRAVRAIRSIGSHVEQRRSGRKDDGAAVDVQPDRQRMRRNSPTCSRARRLARVEGDFNWTPTALATRAPLLLRLRVRPAACRRTQTPDLDW